MTKKEYKIDPGKIKSNSEETSAIASISYEIENANDNGLNKARITEQVTYLKNQDKFPKNLDYIESYTDPSTGPRQRHF